MNKPNLVDIPKNIPSVAEIITPKDKMNRTINTILILFFCVMAYYIYTMYVQRKEENRRMCHLEICQIQPNVQPYNLNHSF